MSSRKSGGTRSTEALRAVPLFAGLTDKELKQIAQQTKEVSFPAGTAICTEGEKAVGMHVVLDGETKVQIGGRTRRRMGPGSFFGEVAILDGGPRSATVIAETDVRTIALPFWNFKNVLKENPKIALKMLEEVASRLRETGTDLNS
ncbi:MAG: cyclic nucleotide-binding domain-containing protein [Actinomycetota bacterium]